MRIISLIGPPGAGKDTQAQILANNHGVKVIKVGALARNIDDEQVQSRLDRGELVDHQFIERLIESELEELANTQTVIIDGFPRDKKQVELFNRSPFANQLERVILLDIPPEESRKRIQKRLKQEERSDDRRQVFRRRLEIYQNQTLPVVDHYQQEGLLEKVDGVGSIEQVTKRMEAALNL